VQAEQQCTGQANTMAQKHAIYTIGHSTHSLEEFIALLQQADVTFLGDVRSMAEGYPVFHIMGMDKIEAARMTDAAMKAGARQLRYQA
jgi:hypothetical protein